MHATGFDYIQDFVVDPMHLLFLNLAEEICDSFFGSKYQVLVSRNMYSSNNETEYGMVSPCKSCGN